MTVLKPIKVLIVDDSKTMCSFLEGVLSADPRIEVVGCARDSIGASEKLRKTQPDVMTLDVEMPITDGLTLLKKVMRTRPLPVVMVSCKPESDGGVAQDVIEAGAVDYIFKPSLPQGREQEEYAKDIVDRVCKAALLKVGPGETKLEPKAQDVDISIISQRLVNATAVGGSLNRLIAIGASTGGPEALRKVLADLQAPGSALLISQHMPGRFMEEFAQRLDATSAFTIKIAKDGELIEPGFGYVAPGNQHLVVNREGTDLVCRTNEDALVNGHRPSVDVMFQSLADSVGNAAFGVLLTGMGEDGAVGLKCLHDVGCPTIVQDKFSSAVWGMPGRAFELGAADQVLPVEEIGSAMSLCLRSVSRRQAA